MMWLRGRDERDATRRRWLAGLVVAMVLPMVAVACGGGGGDGGGEAETTAADTAAATGTAGDTGSASGEWSLKDAAAPYAGTTIRILDELTDLQPAMAELVPQFVEETGINVEFSTEGHADVIQKGEADLLAGRGEFDAVMVHDFQMGRIIDADVVEPLDQFQANPELKDPSVNWEDFIPGPTEAVTKYGDERICFPAWNYNYIYWVRSDLLENPEEQAAFEEQYGYPLALPETMDQLRDIAEFFTRDAGETLVGETLSEPMYGFVQEGARLGTPFQGVYWAFMRQFGGGLFDDQGLANANTPENVEALQAYLDLWEFAPPGASEFSLIDIPVVMGEGRAASGFGWSDFFFSVDKEGGSPYAGNFAYAPIPMVGDGANRVTPVSLGCEVMNKASKNKKATFLFMQWMASKLTQDAWFELDHGAMPVRTDTFENPAFTGGNYATLYDAVRPTLEQGSSWTQIPKLFEISDVINLEQQRLISGDQSPEETAAALQAALEDICPDGCFAENAAPMP